MEEDGKRGREGGAASGEMGAVTVVEVWSRFGTSWILVTVYSPAKSSLTIVLYLPTYQGPYLRQIPRIETSEPLRMTCQASPFLPLRPLESTYHYSEDTISIHSDNIGCLGHDIGGAEAETEAKSSDAEGDKDMNDADETIKSVTGGKKDLALRRRELLVDNGLAEVPMINIF
ncbi:pumilio 24 [Artemisia annua]|uniref:Pumilio 24 n=1 Tax=Artemisia annua TaxID=35608 RepID=A0A2U1PJJ5_ARTAN|nr:pumilio 24 [Artemisia annua]